MKLPFPYLPVKFAGRFGRHQHLPAALLEGLGGFADRFQYLACLGLRYGLVLLLGFRFLLLLVLFLLFFVLFFLVLLFLFLLLIGGDLL